MLFTKTGQGYYGNYCLLFQIHTFYTWDQTSHYQTNSVLNEDISSKRLHFGQI